MTVQKPTKTDKVAANNQFSKIQANFRDYTDNRTVVYNSNDGITVV